MVKHWDDAGARTLPQAWYLGLAPCQGVLFCRPGVLAGACILLLAAWAGCSPCRLASRTMIGEPARYSIRLDNKRSLATYQAWAQQEWHHVVVEREDLRLTPDYRDGFFAGFVDLVRAGGPGEPPPIPPREYWNVAARSAEGKQRAEQWIAGFREGAQVARMGNYRAQATLATSLTSSACSDPPAVSDGPQMYSGAPTNSSFDSATPPNTALPAEAKAMSIGEPSANTFPHEEFFSCGPASQGITTNHGLSADVDPSVPCSRMSRSPWIASAAGGTDKNSLPTQITSAPGAVNADANPATRRLAPIADPTRSSQGPGSTMQDTAVDTGRPHPGAAKITQAVEGDTTEYYPWSLSSEGERNAQSSTSASTEDGVVEPAAAERSPQLPAPGLQQPEEVCGSPPPHAPPTVPHRNPREDMSVENLLVR